MRMWVVLVFLVTQTLLTASEGSTGIIPNFHPVNSWLYRGARPRQEGVTEFKQIGIKTIINLERELFEQEPGEVKKERDWAIKANIRFVHIPMHPIWAPKRQEVEKALARITDPANQPVFVHCDRGSDRTGIVMAAYRIRYEGWSVTQAYEEMKKYGARSILLFWWKNLLYNFGIRGKSLNFKTKVVLMMRLPSFLHVYKDNLEAGL